MKIRYLPRTFEQRLRQAAEERAETLRRQEDLQRFPRQLAVPYLVLRHFRGHR